MPNKILIVDDEPFNLDLLEQELMEYEYVIERAVDGVDALEKTESFGPDLILLDYMMPKMSGLEVVKQLRENEKHKAIPVILLTAKASQEDKIAGLDAGADDYVTKPFEMQELTARIEALLRRAPSSPALLPNDALPKRQIVAAMASVAMAPGSSMVNGLIRPKGSVASAASQMYSGGFEVTSPT